MFAIVLFAQQQNKIDSLESLLISKALEQRVDILLELGFEYLNIDNNKAAECGLKVFKYGRQREDSLKLVKAGRLLAAALRRLGQVDSAMIIYSEILVIAKERKYFEDLSRIINSYAIGYIFKAEYDRALKLYFDYISMPESKADTLNLNMVLSNIGLVYYKLKNYDNALIFYNRSLELKHLIKDKFDLDILFVNMGYVMLIKKALLRQSLLLKRD